MTGDTPMAQLATAQGLFADGDIEGAKAQAKRAMGQLLSTHPPFEDRIARLRPWVEKNPQPGKTLDARFKAAFE